MSYIPNTDADRGLMLGALGLSRVEELFAAVPEKHRFPPLALPQALSEPEVMAEMRALAARNAAGQGWSCFAGAGACEHFIPAAVDHLAGRGEFLTAYTPYQPEASQGTLQALFEYQSMTGSLLGMDVVNASHYDGAAAFAEGVLMAVRAGGRRRVVLSAALHPEYREVLASYAAGSGLVLAAPPDPFRSGPVDLAALITSDTACVAVSFPDFLGRIHDWRGLAASAHAAGALFLVAADPFCLGLLSPPGAWGADIVAAEGQALGSPLSFGGPYLGILAVSSAHVRGMPGRLAGETSDGQGRLGYVLTLCTREQHIRREKATSNICTNQGLLALRAAVYLALMGRNGLRRAAELCRLRALQAAKLLGGLPGFELVDGGTPFFKEFVLRCPCAADELVHRLAARRILPGLPLARWFAGHERDLLVCVTETAAPAAIEGLASALREAV